MKFLRVGIPALVASLVVCANATVVRTAEPIDQAPFAAGLTDPASLTKSLDAHIDAAQQKLDQLVAIKGPHTVENTLRLYDDVVLELGRAQNPAIVLANMHPDLEMQKAADAVLAHAREVEANRLSNRAAYDALASIDASKADAASRYYLQRELGAFRRNGVDKDAATRARLTELRGKLATLMGDYRRNVRSTTRSMTIAGADELEGLPADFIARHKPGTTGSITLRPDDADREPIMTFAKNANVRKRMYLEATNIGYPDNVEVLKQIVALRWEIAHMLGFESWAAYEASSRMVGTPQAVQTFLERAVREAKPKVQRESAALLKLKQQDASGATAIDAWDYQYYRERVRKQDFDFDSQSVRPYFAYDRVRDGLLDFANKMFGLTFRARTDIPVWHPSVQVYDVLEGGTLVGRIYFDTHSRQNKQNAGALTAMGAIGAEGRQIPEAVLQASLPGGQANDPGLLTFDNVRVTLFHEFTHCIQNILSGHQRYVGLARVAEDDFIEAIAFGMVEDWVSNPTLLATFARHYQTGAPIPAEMVARMRRANEFAKGMILTGNAAFAHLALLMHERDPKDLNLEALTRDVLTTDAPWLYTDGAHREASFTQAANQNYAAAYYTYTWGLALGKDMQTAFDPNNLFASGPAHRLRDVIMKRGGSQPAASLVREFLGRPFTLDAFSAWINRDPS
jgi:thimet oligopeptidase